MTRVSMPLTTVRTRELRRTMTDAEKVLWSQLKNGQLRCRYRRQHPIGPFIVDFVCLEHKYVVEADGGQHVDNPYDEARTRWLESKGYTVVRFRNNLILGDLNMVKDTIVGHIP